MLMGFQRTSPGLSRQVSEKKRLLSPKEVDSEKVFSKGNRIYEVCFVASQCAVRREESSVRRSGACFSQEMEKGSAVGASVFLKRSSGMHVWGGKKFFRYIGGKRSDFTMQRSACCSACCDLRHKQGHSHQSTEAPETAHSCLKEGLYLTLNGTFETEMTLFSFPWGQHCSWLEKFFVLERSVKRLCIKIICKFLYASPIIWYCFHTFHGAFII